MADKKLYIVKSSFSNTAFGTFEKGGEVEATESEYKAYSMFLELKEPEATPKKVTSTKKESTKEGVEDGHK